MGIIMEEVTVDDRGRILIPKEIRDRLGLKPGSGARLEVERGRLIITPPLSPEEFIRSMEGCIKEGKPTIDPLKLKELWKQSTHQQ
ncbi:hypothetical protein DRO42_05190 [Candidatus Bathyarchaeota archaeon]|nr:MAG: hypothetical protein DRO42_05190 [Candidatus Bathyarchaeota archaeon]